MLSEKAFLSFRLNIETGCWIVAALNLNEMALVYPSPILASSGPFGPLLARSGYLGQDASFYNNPIVMICATVNALTLL